MNSEIDYVKSEYVKNFSIGIKVVPSFNLFLQIRILLINEQKEKQGKSPFFFCISLS